MRPVLRAHLRALRAGGWMDELSSLRPCGHPGPRCGWALSSSLSIISEILPKATEIVRDSAQIYWSVFVHYHHSWLFSVLFVFFLDVFMCLCVYFCRVRSLCQPAEPQFFQSESFIPSIRIFSCFPVEKAMFYPIYVTFCPILTVFP